MNNRQIDALVARELGYTWNDTITICLTDGYPADLEHYTSDIAAAWQVVEWMRRERYVAIKLMNSDKVHVEWATLNVAGEMEQIDAPTAPLAICLAFLRAMGVEVGE